MQTGFERFLGHARATWASALEIWTAGGWAMYAIAGVSFILFAVGTKLFLRLRMKGFRSTPERVWRRWIDRPEERRGPIGEMIDFVVRGETLDDVAAAFSGLRATELAPFDRDLKVMRVCVTVAPLLGLFGTVTGMLATFDALAKGAGGEQTMGQIAKGISEALITTETGLVIALPGLFFTWQLARTHARYRAFLAHLETVCTQSIYGNRRRQGAYGATDAEGLEREAEAASIA